MNDTAHGTIKSYTTGFILSILLTLIPYWLVVNDKVSGIMLGVTIVGFAVLQLAVQVIFFLHLGQESKPRWKGVAFLFMLMVVAIVVLGSLWIMQNLDYNMMSPHETNEHIEHEEAITH